MMADENNPLIPADHNGGPPLDDGHVPEWGDGEACTYFQWKAAVKKARKTTPYDIMMFRLARAEAAGVEYNAYVTEILERGIHLQAKEVNPEEVQKRAEAERVQNRWKNRPRAVIKAL